MIDQDGESLITDGQNPSEVAGWGERPTMTGCCVYLLLLSCWHVSLISGDWPVHGPGLSVAGEKGQKDLGSPEVLEGEQ